MQYFRIWILFKGYVIIKVEGDNVEKFINICVHRKLNFVDIRRYDGYVLLKMLAKQFKDIRKVAKKADCRVKILDRGGFAFFLRRYHKRKSFLLGCIVFISVFFLLWSYVWDIEVIGYPKEGEILGYLEKKNIRIGSIKYGIDVDKLEYCLITNFRDISWVDVRIKGTRLVVNLSCRERMPDISNRDLSCDVVAKRDGIITKVLVKKGIQNVKVGDTVLAGDVLISGMILGEVSDRVEMVHATGTVLAKTIYEQKEEVNCIAVNKLYSGKVSREYRVYLGSKELLKLREGKGVGKYDESRNLKKIRLLKNFVIPFSVEEIKKEYYTESQEVITMYLAKKQALEMARDKILKCIPKNSVILNQHVEYFEYKGKIFVDTVVEVCEDIGKERLLK